VAARGPVAKGKATATAPDAADAVETRGGWGRRRRRRGCGRWWLDLDDGLRRRGSAWSSCIPTCWRRRAGSRLSWRQGCDIMCDIILIVISCVISYVISHMWCHMWCHMDTCDITLWCHIWYHSVMWKNECDITHDVFLWSYDFTCDITDFWLWYHIIVISHCDIIHDITCGVQQNDMIYIYDIICDIMDKLWYHSQTVISHNCDIICDIMSWK
jgi:hypothetical protein